MLLSELISRYVDLKIKGEPQSREWSSISENRMEREAYKQSLEELETAIDQAVVQTGHAEEDREHQAHQAYAASISASAYPINS